MIFFEQRIPSVGDAGARERDLDFDCVVMLGTPELSRAYGLPLQPIDSKPLNSYINAYVPFDLAYFLPRIFERIIHGHLPAEASFTS